ncbi:MAG: MSMEG_1061 family FMN-dependent PPOX-type flavoprotein [Chloroflexota bacterium]
MDKIELIQDLETLRNLCGDHHPHTPYKVQSQLTEQGQDFIRRSPFMLLTSINQAGEPSISPKGGQRGFVGVGDAKTLYLPDMRGNNLIFSLQNILLNPNVGMLFMMPGTCETLRVHGQATITADEDLCRQYAIGNKPARLVTIVEVTSAYFHCSLSLNKGRIWEPESWEERFKVNFISEIVPNLPPELRKKSSQTN